MHFFGNQLLEWYKINQRDLPWRKTKNPYKIWISEVILQQTQVKQGLPYYYKFIDKYPTINDLSEAGIDEILNLWQGLGYYSRARNMHKTAQTIVEKFNGIFPTKYADILMLKGIGTYTAAAISSFCYDKPVAVLDGNVFRVLSRINNINTPINSSTGKKVFSDLAEKSLLRTDPGNYNQAIMELGALICKPSNPLCHECPLMNFCQSYTLNNQSELPVKIKNKPKKERFFNYICLDDGKRTVIEKRNSNDIWKELYQFPLTEENHLLSKEELPHYFKSDFPYEIVNVYDDTHILTHQKIYARLFHLSSKQNLTQGSVSWHEFDDFPIPRLIEKLVLKMKE